MDSDDSKPVKKRRKPRAVNIPWLRIIHDFSNGESLESLAVKYQMARETISRRKASDERRGTPWPTRNELNHAIITAVTEKVAAEVGGDLAEDLQMHSELAKLLMDASRQTIENYKAGKIQPSDKQNMADVFNSVVSGVKNAVHTSREINGLRAGQSSTNSESDGPRKLVFEIAEETEEAEAS